MGEIRVKLFFQYDISQKKTVRPQTQFNTVTHCGVRISPVYNRTKTDGKGGNQSFSGRRLRIKL